MTYAEAVARLLALRGGEHAGMRPGLERIETVLAALGNPEARYALVQVGGTNGKGSVSAMLATILRAAGRRVGLYTSPHLVSFRERIRVDGEAIAEDAVADGMDALGTLIARVDATMFEASTALALDHFAREAVDIAVLEVGLGGRLDATTVGRPAVTVITRIDLDHVEILGSTVEAIAIDKSAILRSGVAFSAAQEPEADAVLRRRAVTVGIPLHVEGCDLRVRVLSRGLDGQRITCEGPGWRLADAALSLAGAYQPSNALLAVAAAQELGVPESAIRDGLEHTWWPGRFQVIGGGPWLVLDSAHNPAGARALARSLREAFGERPVTFVAGILRDKDARGILDALVPLARRLVLTRGPNPRFAEPDALRALVTRDGVTVETTTSIADALARTRPTAPDDVTCVAGSVALIGDILRHRAGGGDIPCSIEKPAASMGPP